MAETTHDKLLAKELLLKVMELKQRTEIHWARKIWHMLGVSTLTLLYAFLPLSWSVGIFALLWLAFVPFDFIRQQNQKLNDFLVHMFRPIMRQSELHKLAGTTFLLTGVLVVSLFFRREIVILTLLFLAFADPIASYFGIRFGKDKIFGHKSLQGSMAAFFVCALIGFIYLYFYGLMFDRLIVISILCGLIGALAELVPVAKLDDNFTLPVLSAIALWILFNLFGTLAVIG